MFIVNVPSSVNSAYNGVWGAYGHSSPGIRMYNNNSTWENGTGAGANGGDFTGGANGAMSLNGGPLQTGDVAFTPGVPQVLEAIGNSPLTATDSVGFNDTDYGSARAYTGLIGEVLAYSGTLTTGQQAAVNAYLNAKWLGIGAGGGNFLPTTTALSLTTSAAAVNLGYGNQTVAELSGVAGSSVYMGAGGVLTTGGDTISTTYAGTLSGDGSLAKVGSGTFTLSGVNTISGGIAVNSGILSVSSGANSGAGPLALGGGTLQITGATAFSGSGNIGLAANSTIDVVNPAGATLSGSISGAYSLTKTGNGLLGLAAANLHSGGTIVSQGTLAAIQPPSTGNPLGSGPVTLSGGVLQLIGNATSQHTISLTAPSFNAGLIAANSVPYPMFGTNSNQGSWDFYEQGAPGTTQGLPTNGLITSQYGPANVQFQLQPYGTNSSINNVVQIQPGGSQTIYLSNPTTFQTLQFLQTGQGGNYFTYTAQLNFSDGSSDTLTTPFTDWTYPTNSLVPNLNYAMTNVGLVGNVGSWGLHLYSGGLSLFENDLTLSAGDQAKTLESITLEPTGGALMFFALSGIGVGVPSQNYGNTVNVTADSIINVPNLSSVTLGSLNIGANQLAVTGAAGTILTMGSATLTGNATFAPATGVTVALGSLNDGGTARTITMAGPGTLTLAAPATSLVAGTQVAITAGTLNSNSATALGTLAQVDVAGGATLSLGASQTVSALSDSGSVLLNGNATHRGQQRQSLLYVLGGDFRRQQPRLVAQSGHRHACPKWRQHIQWRHRCHGRHADAGFPHGPGRRVELDRRPERRLDFRRAAGRNAGHFARGRSSLARAGAGHAGADSAWRFAVRPFVSAGVHEGSNHHSLHFPGRTDFSPWPPPPASDYSGFPELGKTRIGLRVGGSLSRGLV